MDDAILENVSRETKKQLRDYVALLLQWNARINLVSRSTEDEIFTRHIVDSLQLQHYIPPHTKTLVDYGSGAGLPGLVLAIARPELHITCCEQDKRKAAFLLEAKRLLSLDNVTIHAADVALLEGKFDIVTARAFSALDKLLAQAIHHITPTSICLFPKGETYAKEIEGAKRQYHFKVSTHQSTTRHGAKVLILNEINTIREEAL